MGHSVDDGGMFFLGPQKRGTGGTACIPAGLKLSALLVFFDKAIDQGDQLFAGAGQNEGGSGGVPVELEAGGERRDPDLAHWRVRRDDELGWRFFENDIEDAALFFDLEAGFVFFFASDEVFLECVESVFGGAAKFKFVLHTTSLAIELGSFPTHRTVRLCDEWGTAR